MYNPVDEATYYSFLKDYSQLKPDPAGRADLIYMANLEKLKQYKKFIIDPVIVHFAPNAKGTTINPSDLNKRKSDGRCIENRVCPH